MTIDRDMLRLLESFANRPVLLIGEAILDDYVEGATGRICREAPVPVVNVRHRRYAPGGAANTAANLQALGARVSFLSVAGADADGRLLRGALRDQGLSTRYLLTHPLRQTLAKRRVVADGQLLVRFDEGDTHTVDPETETALARILTRLYCRSEVVVVSDYGLGLMTPGLIDLIQKLQQRWPRTLVIDSKRLTLYQKVGASAVKPNYEEVRGLVALPDLQSRAEQIQAAAESILQVTGAQIAAVTLDTEGAIILERGRPTYRTYGRPVSAARAAGAGDSFVAGLALALGGGAATTMAAEIASAASVVAIGRDGTARCPVSELMEFFSPQDKYLGHRARLAARAELYRHQGRRIVFTNGCFDILHRGHVTYLSRAKALGDVLFVGINSDESVRRLKGIDRPINALEDRVGVLSALSCVDHIVSFDDDTASELIECIRPDVFAKGGDYVGKELPEAPLVEKLGGRVVLLPYLDASSTTRTIDRIRRPRSPADSAPVHRNL